MPKELTLPKTVDEDGDDGRYHAVRFKSDGGGGGGGGEGEHKAESAPPPPNAIFLSRGDCRRYLEGLLRQATQGDAGDDVPGGRRLPPFASDEAFGASVEANGQPEPMEVDPRLGVQSDGTTTATPEESPPPMDFDALLESTRATYGQFAHGANAARYLRATSDDAAERILRIVSNKRGRHAPDEYEEIEEEEPEKKRGPGRPRKSESAAAAVATLAKRTLAKRGRGAASTPSKTEAKETEDKKKRTPSKTPVDMLPEMPEKAPRAAWIKNYDRLRARAANSTDDDGNINPDVKKNEDPALYAWVKRQRRQYRDTRDGEIGQGDGLFLQGRISREKIELLEDIGFDWKYVPPSERVKKVASGGGESKAPGGPAKGEAAAWKMDWEPRMEELREYADEEREKERERAERGIAVSAEEAEEGEDGKEEDKGDHLEAEQEKRMLEEAVAEERRLEAEEQLEIEAGDQLLEQDGLEVQGVGQPEIQVEGQTATAAEGSEGIASGLVEAAAAAAAASDAAKPEVFVPPKHYVDLPPPSHPLTPFVSYVLRQAGELAGHRPSRLSRSQVEEFRSVLGYATRQERRRAHDDWKDAVKFERMIVELGEYRRKNGHTKVPMEPITELSMWVASQRAEYRRIRGESHARGRGGLPPPSANDNEDAKSNGRRKGAPSRLTPERIVRLTEAGFAFSVLRSTKRHTFEERFDQLVDYKLRHGHLRVPCTDELLGCYVGNLRTAYKMLQEGRGTKYGLTPERIRQLDELGFMWNVGKVRTAEERAAMAEKGRRTFDEWFDELVAFKERFGHAVVPQDFPELGVWVHTTRRYYKLMKEGKRSPLTHEQVTRLVDVGFVFDAQYRRGSKLGEDLRKVGGKKRGTTTTA